MKKYWLLCAWLLPLSAAHADPVAIAQCRKAPDERARLACYDAIVLPTDVGTAVAPNAGRAAMPGAATAPKAAPDAASSFGIERRAASPEPDELRSTIPGPFRGWDPRSKIRLANGQVWEITDGSRASYWLNDPKLRITRGTFGTFFLEIEGVAQRPRVKRIE